MNETQTTPAVPVPQAEPVPASPAQGVDVNPVPQGASLPTNPAPQAVPVNPAPQTVTVNPVPQGAPASANPVPQAVAVPANPDTAPTPDYRALYENLRRENEILRHNAEITQHAPVQGVSGGGAVPVPVDDFTRGFDSDTWGDY